MDEPLFAFHNADIEARLGLKRFVMMGFAVSLAANLLLAIAFVAKDNNHRQTIVPPVISQSFWIDDNSVSPEYLLQMGTYALQLALDNTPQNADYNIKALLKLVAPESYGEIEKTLLANAARLKGNNATTNFAVMSATPDQQRQAVVFNGALSTWIGEKRTSQDARAYLIRFRYSGGKTYIAELRETSVKEPFKDEAAEGATGPRGS
jgi:conjugal transfer pilus assembly protein TraE